LTNIIDVKKEVRDVLLADMGVSSMVGSQVHIGWFERDFNLPCVTIFDPSETVEPAGINDAYDGSSRYQFRHAIVQIDCWSSRNPEERDRLQDAVQRCLLKSSLSAVLFVQEPSIRAIDELDVKPLLWRKSLSYRSLFVREVTA
jgi:hypothetical protein